MMLGILIALDLIAVLRVATLKRRRQEALASIAAFAAVTSTLGAAASHNRRADDYEPSRFRSSGANIVSLADYRRRRRGRIQAVPSLQGTTKRES